MKDHRKEAADKLAEVYQQMVSHAGEKKLIMSDIHLEAYLHAAFNTPESPNSPDHTFPIATTCAVPQARVRKQPHKKTLRSGVLG